MNYKMGGNFFSRKNGSLIQDKDSLYNWCDDILSLKTLGYYPNLQGISGLPNFISINGSKPVDMVSIHNSLPDLNFKVSMKSVMVALAVNTGVLAISELVKVKSVNLVPYPHDLYYYNKYPKMQPILCNPNSKHGPLCAIVYGAIGNTIALPLMAPSFMFTKANITIDERQNGCQCSRDNSSNCNVNAYVLSIMGVNFPTNAAGTFEEYYNDTFNSFEKWVDQYDGDYMKLMDGAINSHDLVVISPSSADLDLCVRPKYGIYDANKSLDRLGMTPEEKTTCIQSKNYTFYGSIDSSTWRTLYFPFKIPMDPISYTYKPISYDYATELLYQNFTDAYFLDFSIVTTTLSVTSSYYVREKSACSDDIFPTDEAWQNLANNPPTSLTLPYYKCSPTATSALSQAIGITTGAIQALFTFIIVVMIPLIIVLLSYYGVVRFNPKYTTIDKESALNELALQVCLCLCLRSEGLYLYIGSVLSNADCCIRQLSCFSIIHHNITNIVYNYHTDTDYYLLLNN